MRTAGTPVVACRHLQAASVVLLATLLVAGCSRTSVTQGQPEATPTADAPASSQQAATPTSSTPARPADLDLTGKDPCTVISAAALADLGYLVPELPSSRVGRASVACSFRFDRTAEGTGLTFDTGTGSAPPSPAPVGTVVAPIEVSGYPAHTVQDQQLGGCTVKVDVHDGQTLSTTSNGSQTQPVAPLCDRAAQFAVLAIAGLAA